MRRGTKLATVVLLAACLAGCSTRQATLVRERLAVIEERVAVVEPQLAETQAALAVVRAEVEVMPDGREKAVAGAVADHLTQGVDAALETIEAAKAIAAKMREAVAENESPADAIEDVGRAANEMLPGPWGGLAATGASLLALAVRELQNRKKLADASAETLLAENVAAEIVRSVEPVMRELDPEKLDLLRAVQSREAQMFVDEVQGKV